MKTAASNQTNCWKIQEKLERKRKKQTLVEQTYEWIGLEWNT